jgi:putative flavoprotein involved in K+ transport
MSVMDVGAAVIIGGGSAGLATARELRRRGITSVVMERGDGPGARWQSRYDGLRLNTCRSLSHLPGRRLPRPAGRYPSREALVDYLHGYAREHDLDVRCGVEARRIDRHEHGWAVATADDRWTARNVVVATGWDAEPKLPAWALESRFAGPLLHTAQLTDLSRFRDRRVLVVGAGNSGIDLAGLLVRAGAAVTVSMRTPPSIFPRDWLGVPLGFLALVAEPQPSALADAFGRFIQWQVYGDLSAHGLPRPTEGYATCFRRTGVNPAVDDGFVAGLKAGQAEVVGEVDRLETDAAVLVNGARVHVDVVICATGYRRGLERLVGHLSVLDDRGVPRYPRGAPSDPTTPGLYFAGYQVVLSGSIRASGRHARRIGRAIAAQVRQPA